MKKISVLLLTIAISISLCGCGGLTDAASDMLHNSVGDDVGDAFDNAVEQGRQELENVKDQLVNELKSKLQSELDNAQEDVRAAIESKIEETKDAVASTTIFTTIPNLSGGETAILSNFPNAKLIVTLTEYPIGTKLPDPADKTSSTFTLTIDGEEVAMGSMQCCAYARYVQHKLYGEHDTKLPADSPNFRNVLDDFTSGGTIPAGTLTIDQLKEVITAAGSGAHLRTAGKQHSMFVVEVNEDGFMIVDANSDNKMTIRQHYYTWQGYMDDIWAERGFAYIKVYDPQE